MVSYRELMVMAVLAGVNAQAGEWNDGSSDGGSPESPSGSGWIVDIETYYDVTLHVHSHTPI